MKITILTLFPEMFTGILENSIIKRALGNDVVSIKLVNIRDYTTDKYGRVDSAPVGGGAGLIMKCQPIIDALKDNTTPESKIYMLSPKGGTYSQQMAHQLKDNVNDLVLLCGHYEGIDDRVNKYVDGFISIGDYILTGGEIGAMAVVDSIVRLLDGAIANESTEEESFEDGCLEYPQFTEPYEYNGEKIPDVLYSGNHGAIKKWRRKESLKLTREKRPDLFKKLELSKQDKKLIQEIDDGTIGKWETDAIEKGKKFIK